jgi:hypothetical protein
MRRNAMGQPFDVESFISNLNEDIDQTVDQATGQDQEAAQVADVSQGDQSNEQVLAQDVDTTTVGGDGGTATSVGGAGGAGTGVGGDAGDIDQDGKFNINFGDSEGGAGTGVGGDGGDAGDADASGGNASADVIVEGSQDSDQNEEIDLEQDLEQEEDSDQDAENDAEQEEEVEEIDA